MDGKIEALHSLVSQEADTKLTALDARLRHDSQADLLAASASLTRVLDDDRDQAKARADDLEARLALQADLLREEYARSLAAAKGMW